MTSATLQGRSILIVEDEPLIALELTTAFEAAGAAVTTTNTLRHAMILVEHDGLSAAILDHGLGDGDSSPLCHRLKERDIPFLIYSGFGSIDEGACAKAPHVSKPASPAVLVATLVGLLGQQQQTH